MVGVEIWKTGDGVITNGSKEAREAILTIYQDLQSGFQQVLEECSLKVAKTQDQSTRGDPTYVPFQVSKPRAYLLLRKKRTPKQSTQSTQSTQSAQSTIQSTLSKQSTQSIQSTMQSIQVNQAHIQVNFRACQPFKKGVSIALFKTETVIFVLNGVQSI